MRQQQEEENEQREELVDHIHLLENGQDENTEEDWNPDPNQKNSKNR